MQRLSVDDSLVRRLEVLEYFIVEVVGRGFHHATWSRFNSPYILRRTRAADEAVLHDRTWCSNRRTKSAVGRRDCAKISLDEVAQHTEVLVEIIGYVVLSKLEKLNLEWRISGLAISDHHKASIDVSVQQNELNSPNERLSEVSSSAGSGWQNGWAPWVGIRVFQVLDWGKRCPAIESIDGHLVIAKRSQETTK